MRENKKTPVGVLSIDARPLLAVMYGVPERTRTTICPLGEDCSILLSYGDVKP